MANPQVSATIPSALYEQIVELSKKNNRSVSEMVAILLQRALNERNRKRKAITTKNAKV